jgi:hypothetical protein
MIKKFLLIIQKHKAISLYVFVALLCFVGLFTPDGDEYFSQPGRSNTRLYAVIVMIIVLIILLVYSVSIRRRKK